MDPKSESKMVNLSLNEIINGCASHQGLVPLVKEFLSDQDCLSKKLEGYLDLISGRASGAIRTNARFARDFITNHPDYQHDSLISERINFDFMAMVKSIEKTKVD